MKKLLIIIPLIITGCHTPFAHNVSTPLINNQESRLQVIGALSNGVDVSLTKQDVPAAKNLNDKISSLSETPTPEQTKQVLASLNDFNASKALEGQITGLIEQKRLNEQQTRLAVDLLTTELATARTEKKATEERLAELSNPLTAIAYGIKTLVKRLAWTIAGCGIAFLLLRVFAASNPIIGAIWTIVERMVGWLITAIANIFPKAVTYGSSLFQKRNDTLEVLVDTIQSLPDTATISELKTQLSKDTDAAHRKVILEIKQELGW